ncbi:unnamed protein product [Vitrella brassicaformis CCMP3155]|uniref:Uncharacterized protein n=3 Tax=Vitrella brassicaformis TaxID=1169539 RepID=A0A0G4FY40_VITBC|nr:unnamed protein product [Vitrella brassicaformis CCMP3155]|eukprot:CEM20069.1 unnamed protein product [Vitrella brassicaformis CCMP3155]
MYGHPGYSRPAQAPQNLTVTVSGSSVQYLGAPQYIQYSLPEHTQAAFYAQQQQYGQAPQSYSYQQQQYQQYQQQPYQALSQQQYQPQQQQPQYYRSSMAPQRQPTPQPQPGYAYHTQSGAHGAAQQHPSGQSYLLPPSAGGGGASMDQSFKVTSSAAMDHSIRRGSIRDSIKVASIDYTLKSRPMPVTQSFQQQQQQQQQPVAAAQAQAQPPLPVQDPLSTTGRPSARWERPPAPTAAAAAMAPASAVKVPTPPKAEPPRQTAVSRVHQREDTKAQHRPAPAPAEPPSGVMDAAAHPPSVSTETETESRGWVSPSVPETAAGVVVQGEGSLALPIARKGEQGAEVAAEMRWFCDKCFVIILGADHQHDCLATHVSGISQDLPELDHHIEHHVSAMQMLTDDDGNVGKIAQFIAMSRLMKVAYAALAANQDIKAKDAAYVADVRQRLEDVRDEVLCFVYEPNVLDAWNKLGPYVLQKLKLMQGNAKRAAEEGQVAAKETTVPQLPPITSEDHSIEFAPILEYALHAKAPAADSAAVVRYTYFLGLDIYVKLHQSFFLRGHTAGYRTFDLWKKAEREKVEPEGYLAFLRRELATS